MKRRRVVLPAGILWGAAAIAGCAKQEMPPGHAPDSEPPAVVEMYPAYGAVAPDLEGDAFVRFDEPLGDPRSLERSLITSPAWTYVVSAGRRGARIRPRDGWRRDVVYHFTIPPGLRDLIRNQTREPIEFLFSTADTITATSTTGRVLDRSAVRVVRDARLLVIGADSVPYTAVTDTGGNFSIASLPTGEYWAFAFQDQNRNLVLDREFEPHDSGRVELADVLAEVRLELWLVPPDSTPPLLASAEPLDSLRLRLEFDELLEPDYALDSATVGVRHRDSGESWPVDTIVVGPLSAATPDTVSVVAEDDEAPREEPDQVADTASVTGRPEEERARPQNIVTVRLTRPLEAASYEVSARGFANLRLLVGGGDTTFVYEPPPTPDPVAADSIPDPASQPDPEEGEP